jgi:hypothetical protein
MKRRLRAVRLKLSSLDKNGETRLHSILVCVFLDRYGGLISTLGFIQKNPW